MSNKRVLLGMSGGVDSSVSAILLQEAGYEVVGCTMRLCDDADLAIKDAKKVCEKLNIEHHILDIRSEFKNCVIDKFIDEYNNVRTPNPCVDCNKNIKFGIFYQKAKELNCEFVATGHYAKIEFSEKYNQYVLKKSDEELKDQTYFLYTILKEKLPYIIFPLQNNISKELTRKIAHEHQLEVANKKDSQEICFIENNNYQAFLEKYNINKSKSGNIVLRTGEILGKHTGLTNYTIGQRKGLGVSYKEPLYVIKLDKKKNEVIVGNEKELYSKQLEADNLNWMVFDKLDNEIACYAKIRYRSKEAECKVIPNGNEVIVEFVEPQRAITPGQSVVFYDSDGVILGGGKIK